MRLQNRKICFLVAHEFEDVELLYPVLRLSEEGADITVATLPRERHFHTRPYFPEKPITGRFGVTVPFVVLEEGKHYKHCELDVLTGTEADAFVIPGGFSPDYLRVDQRTLQIVANAYRAGKLIAAICHGPQVLISTDRICHTDMVRNREVTAYRAVQDDLLNAGGKYVDVPAVRRGNVLTGRVPDDLPAFCREIIRYFDTADTNKEASRHG